MNLLNMFYSAVLALSLSSGLYGCATSGRCPPEGCIADATITNNVRDLLDRHPEFGPPGSIEVQTFDRVVYLNGLVDAGLDRHLAESVALRAPGVLKVVNSVVVEK
jgi:osmotically-inducible protein OsmY